MPLLKINKEKWAKRLKEMLDDPDYEEPGGVMACNPEIFANMQKSMEERLNFKAGDPVEVKRFIDKDLEDDKIGVVEYTDGFYIYVKLNKSGVSIECYPQELTLIQISEAHPNIDENTLGADKHDPKKDG